MIRFYSVLVVVISVRVLKGNAIYTLSGNFEELKSACKRFATPQLCLSPTNPTVVLDVKDEFPLLNDGEAALVGYAKDFVLVELIGCAKVSDISRYNQNITQVFEPAICYTICGVNKLFALMKTVNNPGTVQCLCVDVNTLGMANTTVDMCNETCGHSHLLCGIHNHASLYIPKMNSVLDVESLQNKEMSLEDGLNCLSLFNPHYNLFNWKNCYENYTSACIFDRNATFISRETSWIMASTACLSRAGRLMTRDEALTVKNKQTRAWTADVRILTVVNNSDYSTSIRQFGYVSRTGNTYTINFTRNTSLFKKGWCEQGFDKLYVQNSTICGNTSATCTIATPKLRGHDHNIVSIVNETMSDLSTPNTGTWVGYTRDYVVLQITGCISISDIPTGNYTIQPGVSKPFYCYTLCTEYEQFGLSNINETFSVCRCINYKLAQINTTRRGCNMACKPPGHMVCGRKGFAAVYKKVAKFNDDSSTTGIEITDGEGDCLSYGSNRFSWQNCTISLRPACITDRNATNDDTSISVQPWSDAVAMCFNYDRYPIPFRTNIVNTNNDGSWSGIIRGKTIKSMSAIADGCCWPCPSREYGYITMDGGLFYLDFTNDTTRFNRTLCTNYNRTHAAETSDTDTTTDVGVTAGVIVASVVVVIAAITGVCYWNRRKKCYKNRGERYTRENNEDQQTSKSMSNVTYTHDTQIGILSGAGRNDKERSKGREDTVDTSATDSHYFILDKVHDVNVDPNVSDPQHFVPETVRDYSQGEFTGTQNGADDDNYNVIEADTTQAEGEGHGSKHDTNNYNNTSTMADVYDHMNQPETDVMNNEYDRIHPDKGNGMLSDDYDHTGPIGLRSEHVEHYDTVSAVRNNMPDGVYDTSANVNTFSETDAGNEHYDSTSGHLHARWHGVYDTTVNLRMGDNDGNYSTTSGLQYSTRNDTYDTTVNNKD